MAYSTVPSTVGGCSFDFLCENDFPNYACDNLISLSKESQGDGGAPSLSQATKKLIGHVKDCMQSIEIGRGRKIKQFYIGKTLTHSKKRVKFDHMKPSTWRLSDGISKRFKKHRDKDYGRDGLVVLTTVTRMAIPSTVRQNKRRVRQELYAFALENRLIQHFLIEKDDPRIANESLHSGGSDGNESIGYPIYMAFKLADSKISQSKDPVSKTKARLWEDPDSEGSQSEDPDSEGSQSEDLDSEGNQSEDPDSEGSQSEDLDSEGSQSEDPDSEGSQSEDPDSEGSQSEDPDSEGSQSEESTV